MNFPWFHKLAPVIAVLASLSLGPIAAADAASVGGSIAAAQAEKPHGQGSLNPIDAAGHKLNITHGPIAALSWPGMTMDFGVAPSVNVAALKPGSQVAFTLTRGADGMFVIDEIKPIE